jgi:ribosomal protein L9
MKVLLIKDLHIGKKGEAKDLPEPMANYLIRVKAAAKHTVAADPEKEEIKKNLAKKIWQRKSKRKR